jgi:hypothetical protein
VHDIAHASSHGENAIISGFKPKQIGNMGVFSSHRQGRSKPKLENINVPTPQKTVGYGPI